MPLNYLCSFAAFHDSHAGSESSGWSISYITSTTGYTVRNINNGAVTVTAYYYKSDGSLTWTRTFTLNTAQVAGFHQSLDPLPDPWEGNILLVSTANIVAIMREDTSSTVGGYNGIVR